MFAPDLNLSGDFLRVGSNSQVLSGRNCYLRSIIGLHELIDAGITVNYG